MKMKKQSSSGPQQGPSSSIGITRFFDAETTGPKLSPEFVVIMSGLFILGIVIVRMFFFS